MDEMKTASAAQQSRGQWTEAQYRAITTRDKTLLLSAAAGSGKTTTLTERVIRMLTDPTDPRDVSRMVIVTFTVAAASDLKDKLTRALNEAIRKDPSNRRLHNQLLLLADADIGTIDSFCRRIVTEFSDCAGISPSYRVCDPNEEAHLLFWCISVDLGDGLRGDLNERRLEVTDERLGIDGCEHGAITTGRFGELDAQDLEEPHDIDLAALV